MTKQKWNWGFPNGHPDRGQPTSFSTRLNDGYQLTLTLQENEDGALICSGLNLQFSEAKERAPKTPINSRYFQLLGLGDALTTARETYADWADILDEVYSEMEIEKSLQDWTLLGSQGFPDTKYAEVAYMYLKYVRQGLENPIAVLAETYGGDKNTWSSRVLEARTRGLLTKPKLGTFGGKLTSRAEKLLPQITKKKGKK